MRSGRALGARGILGERRIARHGEDWDAAGAGIAFEASGQFVSIDPWNIQIGQDGVRQQIERTLERLQAVMRLFDAEPGVPEPFSEEKATVPVVFDQEHE